VRALDRRERPVFGICVGMQLLYAAPTRATTRASGCCRAGRALPRPARRAAHGLGRRARRRGVRGRPAARRRRGGAAVLRALLLRRARPTTPTSSRRTAYGGVDFPCLVREGSVVGTQFHPEKSGEVGRACSRTGSTRCDRARRPALPPHRPSGCRGAPVLTLHPAVDIKDGRAVRLTQGRADEETVYDADPVAAAQRFADAGHRVAARRRPRRRLHRRAAQPPPDRGDRRGDRLPGAGLRRGAHPRGRRGVARLRRRAGRDRHDGADRPGLRRRGPRPRRAADRRRARRAGHDAAGARLDRGGRRPVRRARAFTAMGVPRFVYTDVAKDGMLEGPNVEMLRRVADATTAHGDRLRRGQQPRRPADAGDLPRAGRRGDRRQGALQRRVHARGGAGGRRGPAGSA
jgi:phosphoribosyl isomerase A